MSKPSYICNCDVIHEDIVNDVKSKMQPKDGVTKSAISHQLKALRLANLVKFRREAQIVYYSLADDHVKEIIDKGFEHLWQK